MEDTKSRQEEVLADDEIKRYNKIQEHSLCFIEKNQQTGAIEITPINNNKIILKKVGEVELFIQIIKSYLQML